MSTSPLSLKHSGYTPGVVQWEKFLLSWIEAYHDDLPFGKFVNFEKPTNTDFLSEASSSFRDFVLPKSLIDFHQAYGLLGGKYRQENINHGIGMLDIGDITTLSVFYPELYSIKNEYPINSTDSEYFRYGIEQDYVNSRTDYCSEALVIAQYSFEASELMLLYPSSKTADGEMEVAILGQAWEFRAPSFAEMMRQLSTYCLTDADSLPPYSQVSLKNTCASNVELSNVWWK